MATPPLPPLSPTVATPLAHRKRRHSEMAHEGVALAGKDLNMGKEQLSTNTEEANGKVEEEEEGDREVVGDAVESNASYSNPSDSEEEHELIRDVVDSAELEPWERGGEFCRYIAFPIHPANTFIRPRRRYGAGPRRDLQDPCPTV